MSPLFFLVPIRKKQDTNYNKTNPMKLKQTFTMLAAALALTMSIPAFADEADSVKVIFDFTSLTDQSGQYSGERQCGTDNRWR